MALNFIPSIPLLNQNANTWRRQLDRRFSPKLSNYVTNIFIKCLYHVMSKLMDQNCTLASILIFGEKVGLHSDKTVINYLFFLHKTMIEIRNCLKFLNKSDYSLY